uniref:RUN and TBC1 domain-containing protein 3 n=1 Tax=Saccoglossus kowalevskii TaxID=10224 RepID=A0ABM0MMB5_SACKO|nr:PREDICTED: small G protein signaling modulator 3 homolog [Saccoglossus kowalevskii]
MSGQPTFRPTPGGPFSALTPSMWPQDILAKLAQIEDSGNPPDFCYDEFGFRVDEEDGAEPNSNKLLSQPLIEDPQHRLQWTAHLEFTQNQDVGDLTWSKVDACLPRSDKLRSLVRAGIPHTMRGQLWMRLSGAMTKKRAADTNYQEVVKASSNEHSLTAKQIEKDLLRTMPSNACFSSIHSTGVPRLRRILRSLAWLYPEIGYCQGTGMMAASLLLFLEEEDAFWMMSSIVEDLVPASYYSSTLIGVQADQRVLRQLLVSYLPDLDHVLKEHDIELSLISLHWFLTAFASVVHMKVLLRLWDLFFFEGSVVLFQITLGMLKMKSAMKVSSSLTDVIIDTHRRKHLAYLMAEQGQIVNPESSGNLPKQHLHKRQVARRKSLIGQIFGQDDRSEDLKAKNIRQTELVSDLRESILQIGRHFQSIDPKNAKITLQADYSLESHQKDHEVFVNVTRHRKRRAKALLDFERHDDDELGFRKNDIITIISQKDEHCWVGELNGLRGWFPAKFVELLDERSKQYTTAGDDAVSETITDLVRGVLAPALKALFEHGLRRPNILGGSGHPWLYIEEGSEIIALCCLEKCFLSLGVTNLDKETLHLDVFGVFHWIVRALLDEDGKVLTPEEILYRSVQAINLSHDAAHTQMDVKFRSLICAGLNEQVLHLWLESLCASEQIVEKWYYPWSFLRSPGWVQIKCELRVLSKFSFNLTLNWELPKKEISAPLKESVRDMLVKHHLFSWDLD